MTDIKFAESTGLTAGSGASIVLRLTEFAMLKHPAYGLGSTTWKVVLPYIGTGVIGSVMLGLE